MISNKLTLWIWIIVLIIALISIYLYNTSTINTKFNYNWLFIILIINIINIIVIKTYYIYYDRNYKSGYKGIQGPRGKRGKRGKYITCSHCLTNIYAEKTKEYAPIATINILAPIETNTHLANILNNIDIIKTSSIYNNLQDKITKYETNADFSTIATISTHDINNYNRINKLIIQRPTGKVGYFAIGDTIAASSKIGKNGFVISGDIRNPNSFSNISNIEIEDENAKEDNILETTTTTYGIWRINPPTDFIALGDIINYKKPSLNSVACINKNCAYKLDKSPANLSFGGLYYNIAEENTKQNNNIDNNDDENNNDDNEDNNNDIDVDDVDFRSNTRKNKREVVFIGFWITLLNTVIANVCNNRSITDNTLIYNILNGNSYYLNELGDITDNGILYVRSRLSKTKITPMFSTFYISAYYSQHYNKQLETYMTTNAAELNKLSPAEREKAVQMRVNQYKRKLNNITAEIEESTTLYDICIILFNKLETMIKKRDLLPIQRDFLKLLKAYFPPNRNIYMIKNECLAYNQIDKGRLDNIKALTSILDRYDNKIINIEKDNTSEEGTAATWFENLIRNTEDMLAKNLGHIQSWGIKIKNRQFDDFTNERILYLIEVYDTLVGKLDRTIR